MLEAVHLTKIYKAKGGKDVYALDDVSICFPEKGMVFLLGKSGSGKSTLLNVCGGLDSPTDGEIVVKGRSSSTFSQSDFDSYRNTFVGFVFQEYNILDEFTVEENIALALKLQGKRNDKVAVAEILEQVDMEGYGKRKPNTLSGGQKQRIAIARALIKSPEIIMADEPTGALDSATGKQVFDTLKKLSADKLVIVVSHDREFAEQYADRIIELKDGRIISDVSKSLEARQNTGEQIDIVGDTLTVKDGSALTESDFEYIKKFLLSVKGGAVIATGEKEVETFRKVSHINEDGQREVFNDTREEEIPAKEYSPKESKFIRSHLPASYAFKMGASGLKLKPVRLFFTIFLSTVAFILFGMASTLMLFDSSATLKSSISSGGYTSVNIYEQYYDETTTTITGMIITGSYSTSSRTLSESDVEEYRGKFGSSAVGLVKEYNVISNVDIDSDYYSAELYYKIKSDDAKSCLSDRLLMGTYPSEEVEEDGGNVIYEIAISDYTADMLLEGTFYSALTDSGKTLTLGDWDSLIGKIITFDDGWMYSDDRDDSDDWSWGYSGYTYFKIVGIFSGGNIPEQYDVFKTDSEDLLASFTSGSAFSSFLYDGLQMAAVYPSSYIDSVKYDNVCVPVTDSNISLLCSTVCSDYYPSSSGIVVRTSLSARIATVSYVYTEYIAKICLIAGLIMAFFSSLLLANFISVSISSKKKEIGILRAVGARGADVFKIFYSESFIITLICVLLAGTATWFLCDYLNVLISVGINLFVFGPLPIAVFIALAAATSVIATFIPVCRAAGRKPVESIRAL